MKFILLAALFLAPVLSLADSVAAPQAVEKPPVDTIEVTPDAAPGLFERVRDAHIRAVQKGAIKSS